MSGDNNFFRVLLVEDNKDQIDLIKLILDKEKDLKCKLEYATTGKAAIKKIMEKRDSSTNSTTIPPHNYDIIFLDYRLPDISGIEILMKIKETEIPIVMVTGEGSEEVAVEAMRNGAFDYIVKSIGYYSRIPEIIRNLQRSEKIDSDSIFLMVYKLERIGPTLFFKDTLPFCKEDIDKIALKMGVFYATAVGQGGNYNQGLYGPLPVPEVSSFSSLVYCAIVKDKMQTDPRLKDRKYIFFCLLFPNKISGYLYNRAEISFQFEDCLKNLRDIEEITDDVISELKNNIIHTVNIKKLLIEVTEQNAQLNQLNQEKDRLIRLINLSVMDCKKALYTLKVSTKESEESLKEVIENISLIEGLIQNDK